MKEEVGLAAGDVPVDLVVIEREFQQSVRSNTRRAAKGGHLVPEDAMLRYRDSFEPPALDEGWSSIRVYRNDFDDDAGEGGFTLLSDEIADVGRQFIQWPVLRGGGKPAASGKLGAGMTSAQ